MCDCRRDCYNDYIFYVFFIFTNVSSEINVIFVFLEHHVEKPGRSTITFLILCNLSMWIINTFELKAAPYSMVHREYYGLLPWIIIMHLCLPLTIFFRFHSSIMLADTWLETYSPKHVHHILAKQFKQKEESET